MSWPTANDYVQAMQRPLRRFCKPELQRGQAALDPEGKPQAHSGKRADVFELRGAGKVERWAIACFTQEPRGAARRYQLINEYLRKHPVPALVDTEYHEQGICIRGRWYPITRSRWVDGLPLNSYVREYLDHPDELRLLATEWVRLAQELQNAGIAHGNLQSGTVLAAPGHGGALALRLVDYDGIFVPALAEWPAEELGHPDFQHPQRATNKHYSADGDRFPQLVVLAALYALAVEGRALWERFNTGENLLFRQRDFQEPKKSALLAELWRSESSTVRALSGLLILASLDPISEVPSLQQIADLLRPGAARSALNRWQIEKINRIVGDASVQPSFNLTLDETPKVEIAEADGAELEQNQALPAAEPSISFQAAVREGPPPLPTAAPPPLPTAAALDHPLTQSYQLDAWMPEEVAMMKLHGFVKDAGGQIVRSVPGYIRVHLLDERTVVVPHTPNLLAWLGLVPHSPAAAGVLAVMELHLIHNPTPTRKLTSITLRLAPGPDDETSHQWKRFCDRVYCELRGYVMGTG